MSTTHPADETQEQPVLVAVAEGARWPSWLDICRGSSTVVVAQQVGEPRSRFAERIARRVKEIPHGPLASVLAVDERRQDDISELAQVAEVLGQALVHSADGVPAPGRRLLLTAHQEASPPLRHALMSLAGSLCSSLPGGTEVSVRFGGPTSEQGESGVFAVASGRARADRDRLLVG